MEYKTKKPANREILILGELVDRLVLDKEEYTLIGLKDHVVMAQKSFDLLFHAVRGDRTSEKDLGHLVTIPLLPYEYPQQEDAAKISISKLFRANPSVRIYSTRDISPRLAISPDGQREERAGPSLRFYEVEDIGVGVAIKPFTDYFVARDEFKRQFPQWPEVKKALDKLSREIDSEYS